MTAKYRQAHELLIKAKVIMAELGYEESGIVKNHAAASSARLLTRVIAEHKFAFRDEIIDPYKRHRRNQKG